MRAYCMSYSSEGYIWVYRGLVCPYALNPKHTRSLDYSSGGWGGVGKTLDMHSTHPSVWDLGFRVEDLGFRVWDLGFGM